MSGTLGNIGALMMFLLDDLLVVRDVSWISHQFIDDSQLVAGRILQLRLRRVRIEGACGEGVGGCTRGRVRSPEFKSSAARCDCLPNRESRRESRAARSD